MQQNVENLLKELILDDDFFKLQSLTNKEVNLMDILRVSHKELQHSNFLAWMFSPNESHNLGDYVFKEFIKIYFKENQYENLGGSTGLSVFDFVQLHFDDMEIKREYKNIDLIFLSKKNKFCMIIENKIYATEGGKQLEKYKRFVEGEYADYKHKLYIYLSLEDQNLSDFGTENYVQITYENIVKLLTQILNANQVHLVDQTRFVFEQYLKTLKSMLNQNDEIEILTKQLYAKYKPAFDLVFKYCAVDNLSEINNILKELVENEPSIRCFNSTKTYVRFQPNFLYNEFIKLQEANLFPHNSKLEESTIYLFEFNVRKDGVNFDLKIGEGDSDVRERLYDIYKQNIKFFNAVNKKLQAKWHQSFRKNILSKADCEEFFETGNTDKLKENLTKKFQELMSDLAEYESIIIKQLEATI
jgi:hypothetical protein